MAAKKILDNVYASFRVKWDQGYHAALEACHVGLARPLGAARVHGACAPQGASWPKSCLMPLFSYKTDILNFCYLSEFQKNIFSTRFHFGAFLQFFGNFLSSIATCKLREKKHKNDVINTMNNYEHFIIRYSGAKWTYQVSIPLSWLSK